MKIISVCRTKKKIGQSFLMAHPIEGEPGLVPAAAEDLQPLVEGGVLLLKQAVPTLPPGEMIHLF